MLDAMISLSAMNEFDCRVESYDNHSFVMFEDKSGLGAKFKPSQNRICGWLECMAGPHQIRHTLICSDNFLTHLKTWEKLNL